MPAVVLLKCWVCFVNWQRIVEISLLTFSMALAWTHYGKFSLDIFAQKNKIPMKAAQRLGPVL